MKFPLASFASPTTELFMLIFQHAAPQMRKALVSLREKKRERLALHTTEHGIPRISGFTLELIQFLAFHPRGKPRVYVRMMH